MICNNILHMHERLVLKAFLWVHGLKAFGVEGFGLEGCGFQGIRD